MDERQQVEARIALLLGIIQQLMTTRQHKLFTNKELNPSQFGVLNHFSHAPDRSWTITNLAEVMEMNQPGITKVVSVLLDKKLLESTQDKNDKRKRYLQITPRGLKVCQNIFMSLLPDISHLFETWQDSDLNQMKGHMEKLMRTLDDNRDDIKSV